MPVQFEIHRITDEYKESEHKFVIYNDGRMMVKREK